MAMQFFAGNRLIEAEEIRFDADCVEAIFDSEAFNSVLDEQYRGNGEVQTFDGDVAAQTLVIDEISLQGDLKIVRFTPADQPRKLH
jgi:hypothetical protein